MLADLAQEWQPARVGADLVEQVLRHDLAEATVAVLDRFVEPLERLVRFAAVGVVVGDVVGPVLLELRDQRGQLARLTMIPSRMHHSECRRRGLESQMQIVAVGLRGVVEAIDFDSKKQVELPEQPYTDCENVI